MYFHNSVACETSEAGTILKAIKNATGTSVIFP